MKLLKNKIFKIPWFDSENLEFNDFDIDELLDIQHNQLPSSVERWTYKGSSWTINSIIQHQLFQKTLPVKEVLIFHYLKN